MLLCTHLGFICNIIRPEGRHQKYVANFGFFQINFGRDVAINNINSFLAIKWYNNTYKFFEKRLDSFELNSICEKMYAQLEFSSMRI